jgi:hypothetical protein
MRTHFPEQVQFKAPSGFLSAVETVARCQHTSVSEFLRRWVIPHLPELGAPSAESGSASSAGRPARREQSNNRCPPKKASYTLCVCFSRGRCAGAARAAWHDGGGGFGGVPGTTCTGGTRTTSGGNTRRLSVGGQRGLQIELEPNDARKALDALVRPLTTIGRDG